MTAQTASLHASLRIVSSTGNGSKAESLSTKPARSPLIERAVTATELPGSQPTQRRSTR